MKNKLMVRDSGFAVFKKRTFITTPAHDYHIVAEVYGETNEAAEQKAQHIVKCVNLHEEMLAVVRECYSYFSAPNFTDRYGTAERLKTILDKSK